MLVNRLLPLLLSAATLVLSLPAPLPALEFDYEANSADHDPAIHQALSDVNEMLNEMHKDFQYGPPAPGSAAEARVQAAFGEKWRDHHVDIKSNIDKMRNVKLKMGPSDPAVAAKMYNDDESSVAFTSRKDLREDEHGMIRLGSDWHKKDYGRANRAGTLLHEVSHAVLRTGDNVFHDETDNKNTKYQFIDGDETKKWTDPRDGRIKVKEGYFGQGHTPDSEGIKDIQTEDVIKHGNDVVSKQWKDQVNNSIDPTGNADAWKLYGLQQKTQMADEVRQHTKKCKRPSKQAELPSKFSKTRLRS